MPTKLEMLQTIIQSRRETQTIEAEIEHPTADLVWSSSVTAAAPKIGHEHTRASLTLGKLGARRLYRRIFNGTGAGNACVLEGINKFDTVEGGHAPVPSIGTSDIEGDRVRACGDHFNPKPAAQGARGISPPDNVTTQPDQPGTCNWRGETIQIQGVET